MFAQVLEAVKALEEGVLMDIREGDRRGDSWLGLCPLERWAVVLVWTCLAPLMPPSAVINCKPPLGDRFGCPSLLREMAAKNQSFYGRFGTADQVA